MSAANHGRTRRGRRSHDAHFADELLLLLLGLQLQLGLPGSLSLAAVIILAYDPLDLCQGLASSISDKCGEEGCHVLLRIFLSVWRHP